MKKKILLNKFIYFKIKNLEIFIQIFRKPRNYPLIKDNIDRIKNNQNERINILELFKVILKQMSRFY